MDSGIGRLLIGHFRCVMIRNMIFIYLFNGFLSSCICWAKDKGNEEIKMSRLKFAIFIKQRSLVPFLSKALGISLLVIIDKTCFYRMVRLFNRF